MFAQMNNVAILDGGILAYAGTIGTIVFMNRYMI